MPKPKVNYTWNYFDDIGNNKVKCRICSIEFTKKTTNQQNHLKRHHRIDRTSEEANGSGIVGSTGGGGSSSSASSVCSSSSATASANTASAYSNLMQNVQNGGIPPVVSPTNFTLMYNLLYSLLQTSGNSQAASSSVSNFGAMLAQFNPAFAGMHGSNLSHLTANLTSMMQQQQRNDEDGDEGLDDEDVNINEEEEEVESNAASSSNKYYVHNDTNTSTENSGSPFNETEFANGATAQSLAQNDVNYDYVSNDMEVDSKDFDGHLNKDVLLYWNFDSSDKIVDLSGRGVKTIANDTFQGFDEMEELILKRNKIKKIEPGTFDGLVNLRCLDLSMNHITAFHDHTFKDLGQLDTLLLDNNRLVYVLRDTFTGLANLRQLDLSHNKVLFINVKAFRHMPVLELGAMGEFRMNKNPIERIRVVDGMVYFY